MSTIKKPDTLRAVTSTIRLEQRLDKKDKTGKAPIRIVYQISGQRKFIPTTQKSLPINWDRESQVFIYRRPELAKKTLPKDLMDSLMAETEVREANNILAAAVQAVRDAEAVIRLNGGIVNPGTVIEKLANRTEKKITREDPKTYIVDFIHHFIGWTTDHKKGTLKEYKSLANHLADYEGRKKTRFTFEGDAGMLTGLSAYLSGLKILNKETGLEELKLNNITKAKLINTFKTVLRFAKKPPFKYKVNPDYFDFSIKRKDGDFEVIALTEEELMKVYNLDLSGNTGLDQVRDIFCFSCATGLRYGDLAKLEWKHIRKDNTIYIPTSDKNEKKIEIPFTPISYAIIKKYAGTKKPLPIIASTQKMISNQKLNKKIKVLGEMAGIVEPILIERPYGLESIQLGMIPKNELLSIHVGRKTFTTLSLAKGMAIQDVMAITTHSSFRAVKRYIDVTKERKKAVMAETWGKVNDNNLIAV